MAVKFFRISEKGSLTRPNPTTFFVTLALWLTTMVLLTDYPFIWLFFVVPFCYLLSSFLFSSPFRITLSKILHETRYKTILASPIGSDKLWLKINAHLFEKTNIRVFTGISHEEDEVKEEDDEEEEDKKPQGEKEKVKVIYS